MLGDVAKQALDADRRPFAAIGAADAADVELGRGALGAVNIATATVRATV